MKRFASVLLAVVLMLSLSVFSFATPVLANGDEYIETRSVVPYSLTETSGNVLFVSSRDSSGYTSNTSCYQSGDLWVGSGAILTYVGAASSDYQNSFFIGREDAPVSNTPNYWWNFIGKITDANGYVLQASDFDKFGIYTFSTSTGYLSSKVGDVDPASDNCYQFDDGYLQIAVSNAKWPYSGMGYFLFCNVSNSSVVAPLSFEVEVFDSYYGEDSTTVYPFVFGPDAHSVAPIGPKDPNDHTQYGDAADQVEWYNDAYGAAVDPELGDKMSEATDMILQQEEIESGVIDGLNQYSSQVDPANLSFPTQILNGLSFIGTTFMSSYNALGDIGFVMSLSMMLGVVMVIIGRGEGALARGMSASARERRRTEYSSQRDMNKGG